MSTKPKLVGVIGRAQHGKSTVGAYLETLFGFRPVAFADGLRDAMTKLDPIVTIRHDKDRVHTVRYSEVVEKFGYEQAKAAYPEVRRLLQVFGTEVIRDGFGENAWVDALDRTIFDDEDDMEQFVITDVRFPNEAAYVQANKGILIKVVRPGFDNGVDSTHKSEALVDTLPFDYMLLNNGTLGDLAMGVTRTMQMEFVHPKARWNRGVVREASASA